MLRKQQIPNLLTFARVLAVPVCLVLILFNFACAPYALFWIFAIASLTDYFDGYLARKWNTISPLGTMLDPIADKLLVALMLIYITAQDYVGYWCDNQALETYHLVTLKMLPVAIILLRELYISGLREFLAGKKVALPVSKGGKYKTALQMVAIALLLWSQTYPEWFPPEDYCVNVPANSSVIFGNSDTMGITTFNLGITFLYLAALLALTSAVSYTRVSWKYLR